MPRLNFSPPRSSKYQNNNRRRDISVFLQCFLLVSIETEKNDRQIRNYTGGDPTRQTRTCISTLGSIERLVIRVMIFVDLNRHFNPLVVTPNEG